MPRRSPSWLLVCAALLACNGGLEPRAPCPRGFVGVCGVIQFRGTVPDSTDVVWVVAFAQFPQTSTDLLTFRPVPPPELPLGASIATYELPLASGTYEWILAVWKKTGSLSLTNADTLLREAGFYRDPADTTRPGVVTVSGGATAGVDFVVDFGNMHAVSYWFPPAGP